MRAATYLSANELSLTDKAKPQVIKPTDAVVRLVKTTICGTDLHILVAMFLLVNQEQL